MSVLALLLVLLLAAALLLAVAAADALLLTGTVTGLVVVLAGSGAAGAGVATGAGIGAMAALAGVGVELAGMGVAGGRLAGVCALTVWITPSVPAKTSVVAKKAHAMNLAATDWPGMQANMPEQAGNNEIARHWRARGNALQETTLIPRACSNRH